MSTKPIPLTRQIIADMKPGEELADSENPGLRVRCTDSARVFFYRYRSTDGALRQIKLGEFGALTLAGARTELAKRRLAREQGVDPQIEKRKARDEQRQMREATRQVGYLISHMVEDYIKEVLSKQKRGGESARLLRKEFVPKVGMRPATEVARRELYNRVIEPMMRRAPRCATMLLCRIRCAYAHAADKQRLPDDFVSPTVGIKGAAQVRRKRAFTDAELVMFLKWLPHSPYSRTVRDALQLVLLTGCRSGEVVAALWRDVDMERGVWVIRDTKNKEPHNVMLSLQAQQLLRYREGMGTRFVFPSKDDKHVQQKALGLAQYTARHPRDQGESQDPIEVPWTVHDLRRTMATGLAKLGCPRVVQDRILNHVDGSIGAIYDVHRYDAEARTWLQRWADHLDMLVAPKVVQIETALAA